MQTIADIFVIRGDERLGPFTPHIALKMVEDGRLHRDDICIRAGQRQTQMLRDILGAGQAFESGVSDVFMPSTAPIQQNSRPSIDRSQIVYRGHPSVLNFPWLLVICAGLIVTGVLFWATHGLVLLSGLIFTLFTYIFISIHRAIRQYTVSRKRVEILYGLWVKSSHEVRINDIRTINVKTKGLKGLLGVGNVEFASAGGGGVEVSFRGVRRPHRLKEMIRAIQDGKI